MPLPSDGCPAGSTVDVDVSTFHVYDIGEVKLRVVGGKAGAWGLRRVGLSLYGTLVSSHGTPCLHVCVCVCVLYCVCCGL